MPNPKLVRKVQKMLSATGTFKPHDDLLLSNCLTKKAYMDFEQGMIYYSSKSRTQSIQHKARPNVCLNIS